MNFNNNNEFLNHKDRNDNNHDLFYGQLGSNEHNHIVFDQNGNIKFLRENGQIIADDNFKNLNDPSFDPYKDQ